MRAFETRGAAAMSRGTRRRTAAHVGSQGSGDLPGEGAAECNPERIPIGGPERVAAIEARLPLLRKCADVGRWDPLSLQPCDGVLGGIPVDRNQEGPFADCTQRVPSEYF